MLFVKELGGSLSGYSLRDQLRLNPMFSDQDRQYSMDDLQALVQKLRDEWKVVLLNISF